MTTLRTPDTEQSYIAWKAGKTGKEMCRLCEKEATKLFNYWKIVPNDFPYDRVAEKHDMILPLHHVTEEGLTQEEQAELKNIKETVISNTYNYVLEATHNTKSIPTHFHLHLIVLKEFVG